MSMLILVRQKSVKYVHTLHVHTTHHKHTHTHTHISSHNVLQWDAREKHTTPNYCTMPSLYMYVQNAMKLAT